MVDEVIEDNTEDEVVANKTTLVTEDATTLVNQDKGEEEDVKTAEDKDGDTDESKPEGAPENYEDFTLPEGFELNEDVHTSFVEFAKAKNLTQADAQSLMDMNAESAQAHASNMYAAWDGIQEGWKDAARKDKEYGGADFKANLGTAKRAIAEYGTDEFKTAVEQTGMGNHPEFIRFLYRVGQTLKEDGVMTEGNKAGGKKTAEQLIFPDLN
jgi:hypothetical protein